jgi:hypothetical protein
MINVIVWTGIYPLVERAQAMNRKRLESGVRTGVVVFAAVVGLFASTPIVHGIADTRGGAPCDVNKTINSTCGDATYQSACLYTYTRCYAIPGWRYMTCTMKSMSSNGCARSPRCFPRDDWATTGVCTPSYSDTGTNPPGYTGNSSPSATVGGAQVRASQVR